MGAGGFRFESGCPDFLRGKEQVTMRYNACLSPSDIEARTFEDGVETATLRPVRVPVDFNSLMLSANVRAPSADACVLLEAQVCVMNRWSGFFKLGLLGGNFYTSFPAQQDAFGRVCTDELVLSRAAQAYRCRVKCCGGAEVTLLAASAVETPFVYDEERACRLPAGERSITVWPCSQMVQNSPDKNRICSPTCVYMALKSLGLGVTLPQVLSRVYDQHADIYGNWLFNVAAAGAFGAETFFRRFGSLAELAEFVTPESLTVASIAFEEGELAGAPIARTEGHLVLVRGWQDGKVLAADPAAATEKEVLRAYDAREFARAWLRNKQGASYIVRMR